MSITTKRKLSDVLVDGANSSQLILAEWASKRLEAVVEDAFFEDEKLGSRAIQAVDVHLGQNYQMPRYWILDLEGFFEDEITIDDLLELEEEQLLVIDDKETHVKRIRKFAHDYAQLRAASVFISGYIDPQTSLVETETFSPPQVLKRAAHQFLMASSNKIADYIIACSNDDDESSNSNSDDSDEDSSGDGSDDEDESSVSDSDASSDIGSDDSDEDSSGDGSDEEDGAGGASPRPSPQTDLGCAQVIQELE